MQGGLLLRSDHGNNNDGLRGLPCRVHHEHGLEHGGDVVHRLCSGQVSSHTLCGGHPFYTDSYLYCFVYCK